MCIKNKKLTIEELNNFIETNHPGGKCLATFLINSRQKELFQCYFGHTWKTTPKAVKQGTWCKKCDNNKKTKYNIDLIHAFILKNHSGGQCLESNYINNYTLMKWKCKNDHEWKASWHQIKNGNSWCRECDNQSKRINSSIVYEYIAKNHPGSKCISNIKNVRTKIKCICNNNHIFDIKLWSVLEGHWCRKCSDENKKHTIEDVISFLGLHHPKSKLLSEHYIDNQSKLKIKCEHNHIFLVSFQRLKDGQWCKICSNGYGEKICRYIFEQLFNAKFEKIRPDFLKNPNTNRNLELDGYCAQHNIAFEYQGIQHYKIIKDFKSSQDKLKKQQNRDFLKKQMCDSINLLLIIIPYFNRKFLPIKLKQFIKDICIKNNYNLPENYDNITIDMTYVWENINRL